MRGRVRVTVRAKGEGGVGVGASSKRASPKRGRRHRGAYLQALLEVRAKGEG